MGAKKKQKRLQKAFERSVANYNAMRRAKALVTADDWHRLWGMIEASSAQPVVRDKASNRPVVRDAAWERRKAAAERVMAEESRHLTVRGGRDENWINDRRYRGRPEGN